MSNVGAERVASVGPNLPKTGLMGAIRTVETRLRSAPVAANGPGIAPRPGRFSR
jgi:hypothetical protein